MAGIVTFHMQLIGAGRQIVDEGDGPGYRGHVHHSHVQGVDPAGGDCDVRVEGDPD